MSLSKNGKKILLVILASVVALSVIVAVLWFAFPWLFKYIGIPQDMIKCGKYTGYDVVVVAPNTADTVLDELDSLHIDYIEYEKGRMLVGDGGIVSDDLIHKNLKIYLCAGKYDAQIGNFIVYNGDYSLTVSGDGINKTVITGGSRLYESNGTAISVIGKSSEVSYKSLVENLSITGFDFGIKLKYADKTEIKNVDLNGNHSTAILFENTNDCKIQKCNIENNGNPETDDTGYGISFLYSSKNNVIDADYKNNGNKNAVDFPERGEKELPDNNIINLKMTYDLKDSSKPIRDAKEEAQNAKPTAVSKRFEIENGRIDNTGAVLSTSTQNVKKFSGSAWVFLFNTKISLDINVEEAGNYRIFVVGTSDDGNNKCDYIQINGGTKYLTSFLGKQKGEWQTCQPGTEYWENDELHPIVPTNGFELKEGKNTIDITANWGYCCYDAVIIEKIG